MSAKDALQNKFDSMRIISTHSHHMQRERFSEGFCLADILQNSYAGWIDTGQGNERFSDGIGEFIKKVKHNTYYIWLERALSEIYGLPLLRDCKSTALYDEAVISAYQIPDYHIHLLTDLCRYDKIILDAFWNPGDNNGHPELFTPTYRINMFPLSYSAQVHDHNGNNCYALYGTGQATDIDGHIDYMNACIEKAVTERGCVALKLASAYERGLDYIRASKKQASAVFEKANPTDDDINAFQSYVIDEACKTAARLDIPLQIHTGLGRLIKSNAINLRDLIERNPQTKFVLFHIGYPWMDDICGMAHSMRNVYPDLCWLPLISTHAAARVINELLDVGSADKLFWGCDTWTSEESYGALLAMRHALISALETRIDEGLCSVDEALVLIENIMYNNAKTLYRL